MRIYTIGFTKKSAERFFGLLRDSGAKRVVDVRLHNVSQLAGFAKRDDLAYFLGHRRLVAEYLREHWGTEVEVAHLGWEDRGALPRWANPRPGSHGREEGHP